MEIESTRRFPRAHTFSIVARDPETGMFGVAVQSHWFSVGTRVAWAEPGVGAVATQAMVEVSYGPRGLAAMRSGQSALQALQTLLAADENREVRQVAMVDAAGLVAAHTGKMTISAAGYVVGEGFSVQANMMARPTVWPAMAEAYSAARGDFADRILAALDAAQEAGGDIRGKQSACILIVAAKPSDKPWADRLMDLRVEDHPEPLKELRRLVTVQRAYEAMDQGDYFISLGEVEKARAAYSRGAALAPDIAELPFWVAVTLADIGKLDEALPIFREVFRRDPNLAELLQRLPPVNLLHITSEQMKLILQQRA